MSDATFADGAERPLRLVAVDEADLRVVSALLQDAVLTGQDVAWARRARRVALLVSRFRWERGEAEPERVRAMLVVEGATAVRAQGVPRDDTVLSLLSVEWEGEAGGPGRLVLTFAGDGALAVEAEALEVVLKDVARPHRAVAGRAPRHPA